MGGDDADCNTHPDRERQENRAADRLGMVCTEWYAPKGGRNTHAGAGVAEEKGRVGEHEKREARV